MVFDNDGRNSLKAREKSVQDLFQAKKERRQELSKLPIEEKVKILVLLQKMASPIFTARGLKRIPWKL